VSPVHHRGGLRAPQAAVRFALTFIPAKEKSIAYVGSVLEELSRDARFGIQRISFDGLLRAEGVLNAITQLGVRDDVLNVCFHALSERAGNDPLSTPSSYRFIKHNVDLVIRVVHAMSFLGLALQCSDHPEDLILTRDQFEKMRDGPKTLRPAAR
jgi:hypothetical protein